MVDIRQYLFNGREGLIHLRDCCCVSIQRRVLVSADVKLFDVLVEFAREAVSRMPVALLSFTPI